MNILNLSKKIKILFIITQSEWGGAQKYVYEITTNLDKEKYKVMVAAGGNGELLKQLELAGIQIYALKHLVRDPRPFNDILGLIEIYRLIKKVKPQVLFLNSTKAGFLGSIAGRIARTPKIIYRIGGWAFNDPVSWWQKKLYLLAEKFTAPLKNFIIVNSEFDRKCALHYKIAPTNKLIRIYNGLDLSRLRFLSKKKARNKLFQKIRLTDKPDDLIIGTVANFYKTKGLDYFIRSVKTIIEEKISKNYALLFIIIGGGRGRKKLANLIRKYGLENQFFLIGQLESAYQYLKAFDIFVLPSLKEGMPWVILEAMAAEIPIVATKVGGVPEMIENNKNGLLVEPRKPGELAKGIIKLVNNEKMKTELTRKAKKTVAEKFTISKMVKETEKVIFSPPLL